MAAPIEAFEKLALSTPKIPALHEVSREINTTTSHDLHRESSLMNAKRLDYLAALPVELILMIFSYLDPTAPFLYQSVSRKWRAVLSSPQVLEDALAQWYSAADPPMQFENASGPHSEHEIIYLKLERMQRFRNAKPSSHTVFQTSISLDSVSNDSHITNLIDIIDVAFYGNHVAWIHKSGPVYVVNLRTGANFVVPVEVGGPLGPVWRIYLTNQLLVLQYSIGKGFYAYDLATQEVRSFQVPSKTNIHVAAHGKLVSVLFYPVRAEIPGHADINRAVIVWDFETQTSQSFQITQTVLHMPPHCHPEHQQRCQHFPKLLIVNSARKTVTVFSNTCNEQCQSHVNFQKYDIAGRLLKKELVWLGEYGEPGEPIHFRNVYPTDYDRRFEISFWCQWGDEAYTVIYDDEGSGSWNQGGKGEIENVEHCDIKRPSWKEVEFELEFPMSRMDHFYDEQVTGIIFRRAPKQGLPAITNKIPVPAWKEELDGGTEARHSFLVNDQYAIVFEENCIRVWSFDPHVDMSGYRTDYL